MMLEKKTTEFLEVLSSKEPVPGGGGASAAVGAFAAALGMMVASLTEGKKTYAAVEEEILCAKDRLKEIRDRLVHLADEDARAFEPLSKAYGLPRTTEEEQKVREKVMEEALKEASLVPLTIMETVLESMAELEVLEEKGSTLLKSGTTIAELIRRPELSYEKLAPIDEERPDLPADVQEQVDINIKYDGYIKRQLRQVEQFKKMENKKIPADINYDEIKSLRIEAKQKLNQIRPASVGQASRISGVSPADISVLLVYLKLN